MTWNRNIKLKIFFLKANSIIRNMDETVDPCEDFFEFSCGNFLKTQRIQDDQNRISEFSILRDTASFSIAGWILSLFFFRFRILFSKLLIRFTFGTY